LPLNACDPDHDGLNKRQEESFGTDPHNADTDGDGVDDGDEIDQGTEPLVSDTDGDGLDDGAERDEGTDPLLTDTDGDGYTDFDEVTEGTDPTDAEDRIYAGGWPYNPNKDAMESPDPAEVGLNVGETMSRFEATDQYGDDFYLYDFAQQGKLTIIDASTVTCVPCQVFSAWLSRGPEADMSTEASYGWFRGLVDAGDVQFITVLVHGQHYGDVATLEELEAWEVAYPHERIPVVNDPDGLIMDEISWNGSGWSYPRLVLLDEDMNVIAIGYRAEIMDAVKAELNL